MGMCFSSARMALLRVNPYLHHQNKCRVQQKINENTYLVKYSSSTLVEMSRRGFPITKISAIYVVRVKGEQEHNKHEATSSSPNEN